MPEKLRSRIAITLFVLLCLFTLTGFGCKNSVTGNPEVLNRELLIWGLWQESADVEPLLKSFTEQTGIKAKYKKVASVATYEQDLLEAIAEGRGPDVFVIHHTWIDDKAGILSPAPATIIDERAVRDEFVDVVEHDVVRNNLVYALPTSVDTMALFYNKDIFNGAGIARPPRTWSDFQQMVERVTKVNRLGVIAQSAAALGTAGNINRAADILQLLMIQSGLPIITNQRGVDINNEIGKRALTFYTDFANRGKQVYTWNLQQDYSIDAFAEGETAVMFNYSYHMPTVRAKNPRLNFGVAPMPQIAGSSESNRITFAAYWPFAVTNSSTAPEAAWQLVRFLTSQAPAQALNTAASTPPARRDSVVELQRDPELGVFAEQALAARSWQRVDIAATDTIFNALIDDTITGAATMEDALRRAQDQLNSLRKDTNAGSNN
jgi:multiple sugar transport system substrate-binding protein